jgi:hypothetical protein
MIALTYDDPDTTRQSAHDALREIRTRWFSEEASRLSSDGRVVTVWRKGLKP